MANKNDRFRAMMDEIQMMVAKEAKKLKPLDINQRRMTFDHQFVNGLANYGVAPGDVRRRLDELWASIPVEDFTSVDQLLKMLGRQVIFGGWGALWNLKILKDAHFGKYIRYLDQTVTIAEQLWIESHGSPNA